ncbi:MAG: 2-oxoacid:ferredoxin oxidoreductase subunit beta, partial [Gammaproteobacteria bacterium]|nr:2-oxoacid:ferredoxin oxidoreductase subunit beta [Gammaproteobacteria bacterium]
GLTKGQASPTSKVGTHSPSTPDGSLDMPLRPCVFALGAGARFVARTIDTEAKIMTPILRRAHDYKGASFVEIYQNCPVYNDGIFEYIKNKKNAAESRLILEHGKPLLFGADNEKGIRLNSKTLKLEIVTIGENGITEDDIVVHDETNKVLAQMLAGLKTPEFPEAIGVLYCETDVPSYTDEVYQQRIFVREKKGAADMNALLRTGHTWTVS